MISRSSAISMNVDLFLNLIFLLVEYGPTNKSFIPTHFNKIMLNRLIIQIFYSVPFQNICLEWSSIWFICLWTNFLEAVFTARSFLFF